MRRATRSRVAFASMSMYMARSMLSLVGFLTAVVLFPAPASTASESFSCEQKPLVVKIHADWCGSCRSTQPTWERVKSDLSNQATMVQFDVTDRASYAVAVAEAERLEISDFLDEFRRRTGTIAVLDCKTRKPLEVLSGERDFGKYRDAIQRANPPS